MLLQFVGVVYFVWNGDERLYICFITYLSVARMGKIKLAAPFAIREDGEHVYVFI